MALLENIKVFVRVVELGSLSAAGRHMRLSPAVASHRIKVLEKHLGLRLFNRTTRKMHPTEQGMLYYEGCLKVMRALEDAESSVATVGARPRGDLRVTAPLGLGRSLIGPLVPEFHELYPEISVRLRLSEHLIDLMQEGIDVAIRLAVLTDSSLTMRKIGEFDRVICAAPSYLERFGSPKDPDDLLKHSCLLLRFPGSLQYQWTLKTEAGKIKIPVQGEIDADDGDVLLDWALDGRGVILKPAFEIADHLKSGRLVQVLEDFPAEPVTMAILYPHRRLLAPKVKVFADFMTDRLGAKVKELAELSK